MPFENVGIPVTLSPPNVVGTAETLLLVLTVGCNDRSKDGRSLPLLVGKLDASVVEGCVPRVVGFNVPKVVGFNGPRAVGPFVCRLVGGLV